MAAQGSRLIQHRGPKSRHEFSCQSYLTPNTSNTCILSMFTSIYAYFILQSHVRIYLTQTPAPAALVTPTSNTPLPLPLPRPRCMCDTGKCYYLISVATLPCVTLQGRSVLPVRALPQQSSLRQLPGRRLP